MKLIMENWRAFLSEATWSSSEDFDYPASQQPKYAKDLQSNRVIVFSADATYSEAGNTHGKDSHMIKHYIEFFPDQIKSVTSSTIDLINQLSQDVYVISGEGAASPIDNSQVTNGDILNTYDFINDKVESGEALLDIEKQIYSQHISPLTSDYDKMVDHMMSSAIDVSNPQIKTPENLANILSKQPIIYFKAIYSGAEKEYYVDTKTSAMVGVGDGKVATFFNRAKKGPKRHLSLYQSLKDYASGKSTVPTDDFSLLRDFIDRISQEARASQQVKVKAKPQRKQQKVQNPVEFAKGLSSRGLPADKIKDIIMKKFKKPEPAALGIMKGAGIL